MHEFVEWQILTQDWAKALSQAKIKEAVIADRMNSFLKGNGCLPTPADINELEALWEVHQQKRQALNAFVSRVVKEFTAVN